MIHLFTYLTLIVPPVLIKLIKDRNGVQHPATGEAWFVGLICVCCGGIACIINNSLTVDSWFRATLVSCGGYWMTFPYAFNWYWFSKHYFGAASSRLYYTLTELSDSAIPDKWTAWRKIGWFGRGGVYITIFTLTVLYYEG